jgi:glycerol-3-phosphate dehydrogenase
LCPHTWHVGAEAAWAADEEMAKTLEDLLVRRLGLAHTTLCRGTDAAGPAAGILAARLGWNAARREAEVSAYRAKWDPQRRRPP